MKKSEYSKLNENLMRHRFFQECVLLKIGWDCFFTTALFVFNSIWDENGIRQDLENERHVGLRFDQILEFNFSTPYSPFTLGSIDELSWGFNEISCIEISQDLVKDVQCIKTEILWENDMRKIEIISGLVSVTDG